MAARRPPGELPKRTSSFAKSLTPRGLTTQQARSAAGKYRDSIRISGATSMDATGLAIGKAVRDVKKSAAKAKLPKKLSSKTLKKINK
jgi:hypothetical protein